MKKDNKSITDFQKSSINQLLNYCSEENLPYVADEIHSIVVQKNELLAETNRLELSDHPQKQLLWHLSNSPYFDSTEKMNQFFDLQRLFYYFRSEISSFTVTDDELIEQMFYYYNHDCSGVSKYVESHLEEWIQEKRRDSE